jgi:YD repeat-containing protein
MRCPVCGFDSAGAQAACPRCGSFLGHPLAASTTEPPKTFRYLLGGATVILALLGFAMYRLVKNTDVQKAFRGALAPPVVPAPPRERAIVHGAVVKPEELQAHGKLYFVPLGRQAFSAQSLAGYYRDKFKIEITVLPSVALGNDSYDAARHQYISEELILDMRSAYPKIARAGDAVMIALTDEDMYPRSLGWNFTTSLWLDGRFAVVSSRRNDPRLEDPRRPADPVTQLAGMKRTLTKYIAVLYFHLPVSFDPTSVLHQPLSLGGGSDDLYESDLHSEESANGLRGSGWPCLFYSYSSETASIKQLPPVVQDCDHLPAPASVDDEIFETQLGTGEFFEFALDFQLNSEPPIDFRRAYRSQYTEPMALGRGANDNFNTWLYSDGADKLTFIDIITEDGTREHLARVSPGKGFSPSVVFENRDADGAELYKARLTWDANHFKLQYRDGAWATFLPCSDGRCYWIGYQDAAGHRLQFDRDTSLNLHGLRASDNQGIEFASDSQYRLVSGTDTSGQRVSYEYDGPGRLVRVTHPHGQVTLYQYDVAHHLTSVSVAHRAGDPSALILRNEYDSAGRVQRQTLAGGHATSIEYLPNGRNSRDKVKVTDPAGRVLEIERSSDVAYVVRTTPIRFPIVSSDAKAAMQ